MFLAASFLALQILLCDFKSSVDKAFRNNVRETSPDTDYYDSAIYRMILEPKQRELMECDGCMFELHNVSGMLVKKTGLFQKLADTDLHLIGAYLDDRLQTKYLRILGVGLRPRRCDKRYCNYRCQAKRDARYCSVQATCLTITAQHQLVTEAADYSRRSWMDVYMLSCLLGTRDLPDNTWLSTQPCGYSHNTAHLVHFDAQGTVAPPWGLGVCVLPLMDRDITDARTLSKWLEFARLMGVDRVHLYLSTSSPQLAQTLNFYQNEERPLLNVHNWTEIERHLEQTITDQAAANHCLYENMMTYHYVIITSLDQWLAVGEGRANLKTLCRSADFREKINKFGGFVISSQSDKTSLIVKPSLILATTGRQLIALKEKTDIRTLPKRVIYSHKTCTENENGQRLINLKKTRHSIT